jgi:DNA processing protein
VEALIYKIALTQIPNIGPVLAKNLLSYCGSAEAVFKANEHKLLKIPGIGKKYAHSILNFKNFAEAEHEALFIGKNNIKVLFFSDKEYPQHLKQLVDAPLLLYTKGNYNFNQTRMVGIVGTRNATQQGKDICEQIVKELQAYNVTIVSGLAYGIDATAHKAAIANNIPTVSVFAHGLDTLYPAQNKSIANNILTNGAWVTEYPSNTKPDRENFPTRNRIVAGMCDAIVVVETDIKGGSMITANIAFSYNRDVFAIPSPPNAPKAKGCNWLIKNNKAALIEGGDDIAEMMGWEKGKTIVAPKKTVIPSNLSVDEKLVAGTIKENPLGIDDIATETRLSINKVSLLLLELELKGIVKSLPGKVYKLTL